MESTASKSISFYPEQPGQHAKIHRILKVLGYTIKPKAPLVFHWTYKTVRPHVDIPAERVINILSLDASKEKVLQVNDRVGNPMQVDPATFYGVVVSKGQGQGSKDIKLVQCPTSNIDPERSYMLWIDHRSAPEHLMEYRVPCFLRKEKMEIPLVWVKTFPVSNIWHRAYSDKEKVVLRNVHEVFSCEEYRIIEAFCREMGMEYCELDIVRSNHNGKIYVLDANNTPHNGIYQVLTDMQAEKSDQMLAKSFEWLVS